MEVSSKLHVPVALPPAKERSVPTEQEAGWAPEPVWTFWKRYLLPCGIRGPECLDLASRYTDWATPAPCDAVSSKCQNCAAQICSRQFCTPLNYLLTTVCHKCYIFLLFGFAFYSDFDDSRLTNLILRTVTFGIHGSRRGPFEKGLGSPELHHSTCYLTTSTLLKLHKFNVPSIRMFHLSRNKWT